jgi:hypothetical protein
VLCGAWCGVSQGLNLLPVVTNVLSNEPPANLGPGSRYALVNATS